MTIRNVLYIMCDQLRWDHLGCAGHPFLKTPHIDALAARGVRFNQAYVQSGICGPSRMSFYTGRYVASHGATHNRVPLGVGEVTLGWHLRTLADNPALRRRMGRAARQRAEARFDMRRIAARTAEIILEAAAEGQRKRLSAA